jgi:hypothetical protein
MKTKVIFIFILGLASSAAAPVRGDEVADRDRAYEDRIADLERKVDVLVGELERTRSDMVVPEEPDLESRYGLGPAASKVYVLARGLSIGGYGEGFYRTFVSDKGSQSDTTDWLRGVLYVGYKFSDRIVFNSEIEFEHATTSKEGSVSVEFAALDFFFRDWANARTGLLLLPMGFLNEIHEPPFFYGVNRPDVERFIIPSTWRENGGGLFGNLGETLEYKLYAVNGLDATGFAPSGLRGGRQSGSKALAEDLAAVGRLDWTPLPGLLVGGSFYVGNSGQAQDVEGVAIPDSLTTLFDLHGQWQWRGLHLRSLFTMAFVDEAGKLSRALEDTGDLDPGEAVADAMIGGYGEVAYDVMSWLRGGDGEATLEPFYRFEWYDTQWNMPSGFAADEQRDVRVHTVGLQLKPIPNVVLKADYRNRSARRGTIADEVNLGVGYVF